MGLENDTIRELGQERVRLLLGVGTTWGVCIPIADAYLYPPIVDEGCTNLDP